MDEIIYKYLNKDPRTANYSDEEIQKAVFDFVTKQHKK